MNSNVLTIWGVHIDRDIIRPQDEAYIYALPPNLPTVEWVWQEMDRVWDELGLDNRKALHGQAIGEFYSHPVWIANGVFSSVDPFSVEHREGIAAFINRLGVRRVADYGGGFGELALRLHAVASDIQIDIVEPYPSKLGMLRVEGKARIQFVKAFDGQYDCVIAQDVLEHVEQPLVLTEQMVQATKAGGYLIFANCFYPVIKCHLPSTFYLRHTFVWLVRAMGLKFVGRVEGVNHALVFQRVGEININRVRQLVGIAEIVGSILNLALPILGAIKRKIRFS